MPTSSHAKFLQDARTFLEKAQALPEISSVLAEYGYTPGKMQAGQELLVAAESLSRRKAVEYGEKYEATAKFSKAWEAANVLYQKALKVSRVAFGDDPKGSLALGLGGPRKLSIAGWYEQAGDFYSNLVGEAGYAAKLESFGYTLKRLQSEKEIIDAVMDTRDTKSTEAKEAKASTAARDRKLKELDAWISDLRAICEVAFYDDREPLEKLGPLAPTRKRRRAAARKKPAVALA